jgi:hypothetical protein
MFGPASAPVSSRMLHTPETPDDLAEALNRAARHLRTICLEGNGSKRLMAGPVAGADETISTAALNRVLGYEPRDLTISVEAGLPWREFVALLRQNRQMVPLDPPFAEQATVGGVVAANSSGPRRRLYGTARDMVIGMWFVTLDRKLVQSGGMVVKNVAGLDMAKLMIGSFGTLAAIAVVNFKVQPMPEVERTILLSFADSKAACSGACCSPPLSTCSIRPPPLMAARPGFWRCAPPATRPRWTAMSANWPHTATPSHSMARSTTSSGAAWKISRPVFSPATRRRQWCASLRR